MVFSFIISTHIDYDVVQGVQGPDSLQDNEWDGIACDRIDDQKDGADEIHHVIDQVRILPVVQLPHQESEQEQDHAGNAEIIGNVRHKRSSFHYTIKGALLIGPSPIIMKIVPVFDIPFHSLKISEVLNLIDTLIASGAQHLITTPNPEILLESAWNKSLQRTLQSASLSLPDGIGILWAAKFLSLPSRGWIGTFFQWLFSLGSILLYPAYIRTVLPERVTGTDTMQRICHHCEQKMYSVFLLGARAGVAEAAKKKLQERFPDIRIVGTYPGQPFTSDDEVMIRMINEYNPQILFVAFGAPKQELWISAHLSHMPSVKVAMGIGGAFDFISGSIQRAPSFMQQLGLEWLWRLFQEPKKRLPRIWNAVVVFPVKILRYKLKTT